MKRLGRILAIVGVILLVLLIVLAAAGTWFVRRPWPQVKGMLVVAGLTAPVEVFRDRWGVPQIYAQNEHDLFFAQGYVHAQDRLWQMEFSRRVGSGTLSAALGEATLNTDRFLRSMGLRRAAEQDWALMDDATRTILQAYADGVNAYIDSHRNRLPLEFSLVGVDPAPWTPVDSLSWGAVMAYSLGANYDFELLRARLVAELGEEAAQQLMYPYPEAGPFIVPPEVGGYAWLRSAEFEPFDLLASTLGTGRLNQGSNNWVVHGSRTASGQPLLCNDTHLSLDLPSVWYENGLHGGRFDSVGFSFPGVPLVIIGHNARLAWGVTNLPADVQDLYVEKLDDPDRPTRYEFEGQWVDLEVVRETIEVKGGEPLALEVYLTRHGPILNDVLGDLAGAEPLALQWTAKDGSHLFSSVMKLNLATNWNEFRAALRDWDLPSQNFVYADVEGNIGYQSPGRIPIRAAGHQGTVPVPGWTGEYEWLGFIPFDELPSALNPPNGFFASANNKVVSNDYPYLLTADWPAAYRAQRITDLLAADDSVTWEEMRDLHAETYSLPAEALRPYLLAATPEGDLQIHALQLVQDWDLYNEVDRTGASVYQVWYWFLVQNTLGDELGDELLQEYLPFSEQHVPLLIDMMAQPEHPWFDDSRTPQVEIRDEIIGRSLADAVAWLAERYGDNPDKWEWGRLHTKTFVHQPLGQSGIGLLEKLFNSRTFPARGDDFTVDAAWYDFVEPFAMTGGVSQRLIADLSNWDNSQTMHTTGQSGQLFHRHRVDFVEPWQEIEYHPLPCSRPVVEAQAKAVLTLTPP